MKADQKTNYLYIVRDAGAVHLRKDKRSALEKGGTQKPKRDPLRSDIARYAHGRPSADSSERKVILQQEGTK